MILQGAFGGKETSQEATDDPEALTVVPQGRMEPALSFCKRDLNKIHPA